MKQEEILFSFIRSEIKEIELDEKLKTALTSEEIRRIYIFSKQYDMAHFMASALSKAGLLKSEDTYVRNEWMEAIYYDSQREFTLQEMLSVFEEEKIPSIPLKGVVLCHYYPHSWQRTSCDIDILVHKEDVDRAEEVLYRHGYVRNEYDSIQHDSLVSPNGVHIELHYTLEHRDLPKMNQTLAKVWEHVHLKSGFCYCYEMEPEMFWIFHLAHMGKHLLHGGCGIRPFVDLWLMEKNMPYNKEKLCAMLIDAELLDFWKGVAVLAKEWMEGEPHTKQTELLADYVLEGGTYGTLKNAAQVQAGNGGSKLQYLLELMFPARKLLELSYPSLKKYPYLFPFYYIRRGLGIFKKAKRNAVKTKVSTRNHITENESEITREMLKKLGL